MKLKEFYRTHRSLSYSDMWASPEPVEFGASEEMGQVDLVSSSVSLLRVALAVAACSMLECSIGKRVGALCRRMRLLSIFSPALTPCQGIYI